MKKVIRYVIIGVLTGVIIYYFYPEKKLPPNVEIDKIVVLKSERKLQAFSNGKLLKTYTISLGRNPVGTKEFEGDKKTPEGLYTINDKNPNSGFHKNLGISYPNQEDIKRAEKIGKPVGGDIKIHGIRNRMGIIGKFQRLSDWTAGCIALTNSEIDDLYEHTPIGTPIEIRPCLNINKLISEKYE